MMPGVSFTCQSIFCQGRCVNGIISCQLPKVNGVSFNMAWTSQNRHQARTNFREPFVINAVSAGLEDTQTSTSQFHDFSVTTCQSDKANELKISIEVSGKKTKAVFDDVFSKMVADAQPIPGFRRVKGGKTPNIPQNILLEILGYSKVYKQVITRVINSTISEYVQKEGLSVHKDLRVEQSFEELEEIFEPGDHFKFDAIIGCRD
ncbi:OLC1v1008208C1 [Oldenlandia corymbosa var. corymbosa]|uniref:peptidylprolyl isomerase n=1 Tax=Oldenlandia corymbosa var. corymbosa TaxID=529605 RepID=A0AAV1DLJ8_OLDCO|nr:OLC1v1008208C1 [Oldenlandia corymbosa var. corymbosa]